MRKLLLLGFLALLTSCAAPIGERMTRISPGMTKQEVVHILGKPTAAGGSGGVEVIHYTQDEGWWRNSYYFVRIVDGKVESYGLETRANPVSATNPPLKK